MMIDKQETQQQMTRAMEAPPHQNDVSSAQVSQWTQSVLRSCQLSTNEQDGTHTPSC